MGCDYFLQNIGIGQLDPLFTLIIAGVGETLRRGGFLGWILDIKRLPQIKSKFVHLCHSFIDKESMKLSVQMAPGTFDTFVEV